MFKLMTYAYSQNIYSTRNIETAYRRDINFRWLLAGQPAPDHSTISRFRHDYLADEVLEDLFYQQVMSLYHLEEVRFENVFIDGTKLEANANKYTFVWKKTVLKNEGKMLIYAISVPDLCSCRRDLGFGSDDMANLPPNPADNPV